jgi:hypothetical protein
MTGIREWGELKRSLEVLVIFLSNGHNLWRLQSAYGLAASHERIQILRDAESDKSGVNRE